MSLDHAVKVLRPGDCRPTASCVELPDDQPGVIRHGELPEPLHRQHPPPITDGMVTSFTINTDDQGSIKFLWRCATGRRRDGSNLTETAPRTAWRRGRRRSPS
jgi:hypothetical protein